MWCQQLDWVYVLHQFLGSVFQLVPIILISYAPFSKEEFRFGRKKTVITIVLTVIVFSIFFALYLGNMFDPLTIDSERLRVVNTANILFSVMLIIMTIYYFLSLNKKTQGKAFGYIVGIQYALFVYTLSQIFTKGKFTNLIIHNVYYPYGTNAVITYIVMSLIILPICFFFLHKVNIRILRFQQSRNIFLITVYSLIILVLYIITFLVMNEVNLSSTGYRKEVLMICWLFAMLIVELFVYFFFYFVIRIEKDRATIQNQMTAYDLQYQAMKDKMEQEKRRAHDTRHHFRTLMSLVDNKEYANAANYLKEYLHEWEETSIEKVSNNAKLNNILNYYMAQAKQQGIEVRHDILLKDNYPFDFMDMTVLLGNALENAIEACEKYDEDSWIQIDIRQKKKMILIQIENSCDDTPLEKDAHNNTLYSSKQGRKVGYGINSMIQITNKYQGNLEYWKQDNTFTLRILLAIPEETEKRPI